MKKIQISVALLLILVMMLSFASCGLINSPTVSPCDHEWSAASCRDKVACKKCGKVGDKYGAHEYGSELVAATCKEQGYTLSTCSVCGDTYKNAYTDLLEHTASDWIYDMENVETGGEKYKKCTVCGEVLVKESIEEHTHEFVSVDSKAPTCTEDGHNAYEYCSLCGYSTLVTIPATDHSWGEWTSNGNSAHVSVCENDHTHVKTELCSGTENGDLICSTCGSEYDVSVSKGNGSYGYYALGSYKNGAAMQSLYNRLSETCEDFFSSNEDVLPDDDGYYVIGNYNFADLSLTVDEARSVWKVFCDDNPLYYWLSNITLTSTKEIYLLISEDYAKASFRRECDSAILGFVNECSEFIGAKTEELDVAAAISAYIVKNMEYAYDENGVPEESAWAHNMIGFALYEYGVCESYAKTFMYLCLYNDIDCIIGSGYGNGEKHAWNYVYIDGEWYGADITWCDQLGDQAAYDVFGVSDSEFHADHTLDPSDSFGVNFSYEIPKISDTSIELCELYVNGSSAGLVKSIEDALAQMTDLNAEYEIVIGGFYTFSTEAPVHTIDVDVLPGVKGLKFTGFNHPSDNPVYMDNNTVLMVTSDSLKLAGNVVFENMRIEGKEVVLKDSTLTMVGEMVDLLIAIDADDANSTVSVLTVDAVYFEEKVEIYKLLADDHKMVFYSLAVIEYSDASAVYLGSEASVDIKNHI